MWTTFKNWIESKTIITSIANGFVMLGLIVVALVGYAVYQSSGTKKR